MKIRLANAPVSWGVDYAHDPANPPWATVLDEIALAGYDYIELGPVGYLPEDPEQLGRELRSRGLKVNATFVFDFIHDPAQRARVTAVARRASTLVAGAGGTALVVIDHLVPERMAVAGRSEHGRRLGGPEFEELIRGIRAVAEVAAEHGLRPVLHPHAGTYIEHQDEIDRVMSAIEATQIGLCIDTGHAAFAGIDAVSLFEQYAERVDYLHLKDVDASVHRQALEEGWDFETAVSRGVFCPLGRGVVAFDALHDALRARSFDGAATIEQDRDPEVPAAPVADARRSLRYLEEVGLARKRGVAVAEEA